MKNQPKTEKACTSCKFFQYAFGDKHLYAEVGNCRRYPPVLSDSTMAASKADSAEEAVAVACYFPMVADTDWCGEFQEKS